MLGVGAIVLTWRSVRRRGSRALVGRIDVEDLDPSRRPVIDKEILGGTQLDEHRSRASCLDRGLFLLLHHIIAGGTG